MQAKRRLAAILVTDVVGYSRLMGIDEAQTLRQIKAARNEIVDPALRACQGRVFKTTGDGLLVEFPSAVEAVRCAVHVQHEMAVRNQGVPQDRRIVFRIGIHSSDILGEDEDIFGDGVNVAARLETLCEPGGVCISGRVNEDLAGRLELPFEDRGEQQVKNIARPVRAFGLSHDTAKVLSLPPLDDPGPVAISARTGAKVRLWLGAAATVGFVVVAAGTAYTMLRGAVDVTDRAKAPSIAVLAFDNLSNDAGLNAFADGLSEGLIADIAEFGYYDVLARNTTFIDKGTAVDVHEIGRKLGADYVVEGSVRSSGAKLEITAQLIDAKTGAHLWAQTYPEPVASANRGEFQNDVARRVSVAVGDLGSGAIAAKAFERSREKSPEALSSFECLATARYFILTMRLSAGRARSCLEATVKRDPSSAAAWSALSMVLSQQRWWGLDLPPAEARDVDKRAYLVAPALAAARRALDLAPNAAATHRALAAGYEVACQKDRLRVEAERVIALDPNDVSAQAEMGSILAYSGDWDFGRHLAERAIEITGATAPNWWWWPSAKDYYRKGDYENAYKTFLLSYRDGSWLDLLHVIYTLPYLGRTDEAKSKIPELIQLNPDISVHVANQYYKMFCFDDDYIARMDKALLMAGLRETAQASPMESAAAKP